MFWVAAFLLEALNFSGWGDHRFDLKHNVCMWDRTKDLSYTLFLTISLISLPCFIMIVAYIKIFIKVRHVKNKVSTELHGKLTTDWWETVKSTRTFFLILVAFILTWGPYALVNAMDVSDVLSTEVHLYVSCWAHMHAAANCIIYGVTNPHFKFAYAKVLCIQHIVGHRNVALSLSGEATYDGMVQQATKTLMVTVAPHSIFIEKGEHYGKLNTFPAITYNPDETVNKNSEGHTSDTTRTEIHGIGRSVSGVVSQFEEDSTSYSESVFQ